MKRRVITALVAVFLSLAVAGCYTQLKGPEPGTGERVYHNYYNEYPYYYDYYTPYYFQFGWYNPFSFGYPSFYGGFYNPWWYDPYYYDGGYYRGGGGYPPGKEPRTRRGGRSGDLPSIPSGSYSAPPPSSGQSDAGYQAPPPAPPSNGSGGSSGGQGQDNNSGGKSTRGRR